MFVSLGKNAEVCGGELQSGHPLKRASGAQAGQDSQGGQWAPGQDSSGEHPGGRSLISRTIHIIGQPEATGPRVIPKTTGPLRTGAGLVMHQGDRGNATCGPAIVGQTGEVPVPMSMKMDTRSWTLERIAAGLNRPDVSIPDGRIEASPFD